jgi:isocitrate dehydrogenase (NAD+)
MSTSSPLEIAEFLGDGIASELSEAVHTIADALPIDINFHDVDLTLERRRTDAEGSYDEAEKVMRNIKWR